MVSVEKIRARLDGFENSSIVEMIKRAFIFLVPIFIIGAVSLAVRYFPIPAVRDFIDLELGGFIGELLDAIYSATYGFAAVYLVISISYCFCSAQNFHSDIKTFYILSGVACYMVSLGPTLIKEGANLLKYTNMANLFPAMLISLAQVKLFQVFYRLFNKNKLHNSSAFARSTGVILPMVCCLAVFGFIGTLISLVDGVENVNDLIVNLFSKPFESLGATYFGGLLIMLMQSVLWFFGIHGGNVFELILNSQTGAFAFSEANIMCKQFTDTFVLMGGCGSMLCLFLAILLFTKDKNKKKLCKMGGLPLLFNINELMVFGTPIVLNPIFVIPFILVPVVNYSIAYLATAIGIVPHVLNASVQWTTPVLISGYQATGSVTGSLLQVFLLAVGTLIYIPFVKLDNRCAKSSETRYIEKLTEICKNCELRGEEYSVSNEKLALRTFEYEIAEKLYNDINKQAITVHYQPQVQNGKVVAAEALLRFKYNDEKFLYPPLIIAIACKNQLFTALSREIVKKALKDLLEFQKIQPDFKIAVNVELELIADDEFRHFIIDEVRSSGVMPNTFGVELTENSKLSAALNFECAFNEIKQAGIEILMDDFSMGNTSISILQKNYFDYVKIDGNLIKQLDNERIRSIVSSVVNLGKQLKFSVIAEYVESEWQRDILFNLGCYIYQGYLYYKPSSANDVLEILSQNQNCEKAG